MDYGYDDANRLTSITQGSDVVAFTYDDANRRTTLTYPNGIVATYGYDDANQLTTLTYTLGVAMLGDLTYAYDAAGRRTSVGGSWARTGIPQAMASATYDAANRIVTWGGASFSYDSNGNLASDGLTSYTWNARDQLVAMSGGVSAGFAYDASGRRRSKTVSGTATNFLWDEFNMVQELAANGTLLANLPMASAVDELLMRVDGGGLSTLLNDGIGSTLALADASGTVQTRYTFEPFGATTTSGPSSTNSVAFTGRENDLTGLYYYRARYYSPTTSRFIAEDPIDFAGGDVNLYSYVSNAPVDAGDPFGLIKLPANPGGLGPECTPDPTHLDPNGTRFRDPNGRPLDFHPGRPGEPGWGGRDHWHDPDNFGKRHLPPGSDVPDPAPIPEPKPSPEPEPRRAPPLPIPWRLPFPWPLTTNPCFHPLVRLFLPSCNPMGSPGKCMT